MTDHQTTMRESRPHPDNADLGSSKPLAQPLFQSSVYTLPDLDALDRIIDSREAGYIYARDGHPNARMLADSLAALEGGTWAIVCGSGMAALTAAVLTVTQQGDRIVASNRLYGRSSQLLGQELGRFGIQSAFVDTNDLAAVRTALAKPAKILFVETMSNPLLRIVDLEAIAEIAHESDSLLIVDNTFATPILVKPLELGAYLVVESLTKMIGGHSDVTLGVVSGSKDLLAQITQVVSIWGLSANPFDCWLASRGLNTLGLRMGAASANAAALASWLKEQPGITRVIYPGLADHSDHELAGTLLKGSFGNMLCFELKGGREAVNRFLQRARGIPFSPSLGHTTTTCSHPGTTSHRYIGAAEKRRQGISDGLVRLSVGIEDLEQIKQEISKGLS